MKNIFKKIKRILLFLTPRIRVTKAKTWPMRLSLIFFYVLLALVVINVVVKSLYFYDNTYQYRILSHSYIEAILPEQPIDQPMNTKITRIKEPNLDTLKPGDHVVIHDHDNVLLSLSESFPLIVTVVDIMGENNAIEVSYDATISAMIDHHDIIGSYQKEANFGGIYYYTAMFPMGYYSLMFSHIILLSGYYYILIYDKPSRFLPDKNDHKPKTT